MPGSIRRSPRATARLVTHGHADHARGGHAAAYGRHRAHSRSWRRATDEQTGVIPLPMARRSRIGDVDLYGYRAGRPCARIGADRARFSRRADCRLGRLQAPRRSHLHAASSRSKCDVFVTEATFGLPVFRHPDTGMVRSTSCWRRSMPIRTRCVLVGAYALGKAQRVIARAARHAGMRHRSTSTARYSGLCDLYVEQGVSIWAS